MEQQGIENARLEAELLLAEVLGLKRLDLYLQFDRPIGAAELEQYRGFVRRRLKREPLQYIVGHAAFRKLELQVDRRVLIPRPETEQLVERVIRWAKANGAARALDVGTGSGAIAISLATELGLEVVAVDISPEALAVARANAKKYEVAVEFRQGDLLAPLGAPERFDVIVANLPYVGESEKPGLAPEVAAHEPSSALFAGADGLALIARLVQEAPSHLDGLLALEIGAAQADSVCALIREHGQYSEPDVVRDLAGRDRIVLAARK